MQIIKCDICNKPADTYIQIKYRTVSDGKAGATKHIDVCKKCHDKHFRILENLDK